jgi:hypothetical protein
MSNKDKLYAWLAEHKPEVFARIDQEGMSDMRVLPILNEASGLSGTDDAVLSSEVVEIGSKRFLDAFTAAAEQSSAGRECVSLDDKAECKPQG